MKRISLWSFLIFTIWCVFVSGVIWNFGNDDQAKESDCVIILGAAVNGEKAIISVLGEDYS